MSNTNNKMGKICVLLLKNFIVTPMKTKMTFETNGKLELVLVQIESIKQKCLYGAHLDTKLFHK